MIEEQSVLTTKRSTWTLYGSISEFSTYKELLKALYEANEGDSIELKINSTGGDVAVGMMIVQAMQQTKAVVVCNVVYPCYSMGADIALAGDYLLMQPHTFLMFHTYSCMDGGKSGDLLQSIAHNDLTIKKMMEDLTHPFLTKSELKKMHAGEDIYIRAEDPTLQQRLKRHFDYVPNKG